MWSVLPRQCSYCGMVGTDVLRGEDVIVEDPIRIHLPEKSRILRNTLIGVSNQSNHVHIKEQSWMSNELIIKYDYLNIDDGAVIEVMHDGKQYDPIIIGAAKGLSGGPKGLGGITFHDIEKPEGKRYRLTLMIMMIIGVLFVTMSGIGWVSKSQYWPSVGEFLPNFVGYNLIVVLGIGGLLYMIMPTYEFWKNRRRYPKSLRRFLRTPRARKLKLLS